MDWVTVLGRNRLVRSCEMARSVEWISHPRPSAVLILISSVRARMVRSAIMASSSVAARRSKPSTSLTKEVTSVRTSAANNWPTVLNTSCNRNELSEAHVK